MKQSKLDTKKPTASIYRQDYVSPLGRIILESDGKFLTGLWFADSKDASKFSQDFEQKNLAIFEKTKLWLDIYFTGKQPKFTPKYKLKNISPFAQIVTQIMNKIPFGCTVTYGEIARQIATTQGKQKMSAQAVGGAVGSNPICIIIPCHRVVGAKGNLTGYGGGLDNKIGLLKLENVDLSNFYDPRRTKNEQ